jgi:hypothetical protein
MLTTTWKTPGLDLDLRLTSPAPAEAAAYRLTGVVSGAGRGRLVDGGSVLVLGAADGLAEEAFLDSEGNFAVDLELRPGADNPFRLTVYDPFGREVAGATLTLRAGGPGPAEGGTPPSPAAGELEPPWPQFARRVKECLYLAGKVADATGRPPQELFEQVYAQERYAEEAHAAHDPVRYRECYENLGELARYLEQLCRDRLPG